MVRVRRLDQFAVSDLGAFGGGRVADVEEVTVDAGDRTGFVRGAGQRAAFGDVARGQQVGADSRFVQVDGEDLPVLPTALAERFQMVEGDPGTELLRLVDQRQSFFGARKSGSRRLMNQVDTILSALEIQPFEEPADRTYGALRVTLEKKGKAIGPNYLLIAAQALVLDSVVVTANQREFFRVPGLKVQNWLRG